MKASVLKKCWMPATLQQIWSLSRSSKLSQQELLQSSYSAKPQQRLEAVRDNACCHRNSTRPLTFWGSSDWHQIACPHSLLLSAASEPCVDEWAGASSASAYPSGRVSQEMTAISAVQASVNAPAVLLQSVLIWSNWNLFSVSSMTMKMTGNDPISTR